MKKVEHVENEDVFNDFSLFDFDDWGKQTIGTSAEPKKSENIKHVSCKWPSKKEAKGTKRSLKSFKVGFKFLSLYQIISLL